MRRVLASLVSSFMCFQLQAIDIVYVHLGTKPLPCLMTVVQQARYMNPNDDIYLLMDQDAMQGLTFPEEGFLARYRIFLMDVANIPMTEEHIQYRSISKINKTRRTSKINKTRSISKINKILASGLWAAALERFFYLHDLMVFYDLHDVFHFENDSMLYVELNEIMPCIRQSNIEIAVPFESTVASVPCLVFLKQQTISKALVKHILEKTKLYQGNCHHIDIGDMALLANFPRMTVLPTLMHEYAERFSKRKSSYDLDNQTPLEFLSQNEGMFPNYLFDAAALGVFVNGNDKRYNPHTKPGVVHHRSIFDPREFLLFWGEDRLGKKVPYLTFQDKTYRIVNLHFHSKDPEGYTSFKGEQKPFPPKHQEKRSKYFIAIKPNSGKITETLATLTAYQPFLPPKGRYYADPMVFTWDGTHYLFFEDYDYKKGVIGCAIIDPSGGVSQIETVLELPIHLSFPYVFEDKGKIYMTPETYDANEVALFEAKEFPHRWEKKRVLVEGEAFADPMIFWHEGYYWLFTAVQGDRLRIYYANDLDQPFQPHPINQANLRGRNAGGVFLYKHQKIRPVMDCVKGYGHEMVLNEIRVLNPNRFKEKTIYRIKPTWAPGLDGTHTYNQNEAFVIYDGRRTLLKEET